MKAVKIIQVVAPPFAHIACLKRFQAILRETGSLNAFLKIFPTITRDETIYILGFIGLNNPLFVRDWESA